MNVWPWNAIDYLPTISYDVCNVIFINVFNVFCIKLKRKHGKARKHGIVCWSNKKNIQRFIQRTWANAVNDCRIDGIPEYKEDSWDDTKELLKDALRKKMDANKIKIETANRVGAK